MSRLRRVMAAFMDNPVLLKELRMGLRERRIFVIQTIYLVLVGLVTLIFLAQVADQNRTDVATLASAGREFFTFQFWMQLVMVVLITPSLTCGLLTTEREKKSLDMLLASRLTAGEVVLGKLGFALSYMALLLFSALPLTALVFFVGGVSPGELALAYFHLGLAVLISAQIGLAFSAREQRTAHATNQSYGLVVLALIFLTPVLAAFAALAQAIPGGFASPELILMLELGYLSALMFLKTVNHLRPQLKYVRRMCQLFVLMYLLNVGLTCLGLLDAGSNSDDGSLWVLFLMMHLFLLGFFLTEPRLLSPREILLYRTSLMARPMIWCGLFAVGLVALAGTARAAGAKEWVYSAAALTAIYLACYAIMARCLAAMMGPKGHVATCYYTLVAVSSVLPSFVLASGGRTYSLISCIYMSPLIAVNSLSNGEPELSGSPGGSVALASMVFFALATTLMWVLARKKMIPRPPPQSPAALDSGSAA